MSGLGGDYAGHCENCDHETQVAWQVTHPQTATHWRCSECLRSLLAAPADHPVLVTGFVKPTSGTRVTNLVAARKASWAARDVFLAHQPRERGRGE